MSLSLEPSFLKPSVRISEKEGCFLIWHPQEALGAAERREHSGGDQGEELQGVLAYREA